MVDILSLPLADGVAYSGNTVDYYVPTDPVIWTVDNRPLKNLAYRDYVLGSKLDEVVGVVNGHITTLGTATGDIADLQAVVGSTSNTMLPWDVGVAYIAAKTTLKSAIEELDIIMQGLDLSLDVSNLETALGTSTDVFIGAETTNYVDNLSARGAVLALDLVLGTAATQADNAANKLDGDMAGTTMSWAVENAWATGTRTVLTALNAIDQALQEVDPTEFAAIKTTLDPFTLDPPVFMGGAEGTITVQGKTAHDAVLALDGVADDHETRIGEVEAELSDANTGLSATNTIAVDNADLSSLFKRGIEVQQSNGQFHYLIVDIFDEAGLDAGTKKVPFERFRFMTAPPSNFVYMRPIAAPNAVADFAAPSLAERTYSLSLGGGILSPKSRPGVGKSTKNVLALTWRRARVWDFGGTEALTALPLGASSFALTSGIATMASPWVTAVSDPGGSSFMTGDIINPRFVSSTINWATGAIDVVFSEAYTPFYVKNQTYGFGGALTENYANCLPLLYASYFAAPNTDFLFFGNGVHALNGQSSVRDRGVVVSKSTDGMLDKSLITGYTSEPSLNFSHWHHALNRPFAASGESYWTFIPELLADAGYIKRSKPLFVRVRAVHESALIGTLLASPWESAIISF